MEVEEYTYRGGGLLVDENEQHCYDLESYLLKILQQGPMTRGQLSKATDIPRTTIYDVLVKLILQNKVEKFTKNNNKPGRPKVYYRLKKFHRKQKPPYFLMEHQNNFFSIFL